jgi:hypothetical protein
MHEAGHQAVGHVLLITVVSGGALVMAAQIGDIAVAGLTRLLTALG